MTRFSNKTAVILGGTSGIGLAAAQQIASEGGRVYIAGRRPEYGEKAVSEASGEGMKLHYVQVDMTEERQVEVLFDTVRRDVDRLDALIISHGTLGNPAPVVEQSARDFQSTVNTNLVGSFLAAKYALPLMSTGSSILFVSSTVGSGVVFPGTSAYASSKAGLRALAETLALETAEQGIRVNVLVPGGVDTPMFRSTMGATPESAAHIASLHAMGRVGEASELGRAAAFMVSSDASFVTGSELVVDGGMRIR